jgi:hypothetical protein
MDLRPYRDDDQTLLKQIIANQQATRHTDIHVHGRGARAKVIATLARAFPGKPWHTVGNHFVVEGTDARRRVLSALAPLGRVSFE